MSGYPMALDGSKLVNVVDAPSTGTFLTPAVHRAGDLTIAVSAGRLPAAAPASYSDVESGSPAAKVGSWR